MKNRKLVYISHPYTTDPGIEINAMYIKDICKMVSQNHPDIAPLAPTYSLGWLDDPYNEEENARALAYCIDMLTRCDEVWFFGDWKRSVGCQAEYEAAIKLNIPWKDHSAAIIF